MPECNKWLNFVIRLNTVNDITLFYLSYVRNLILARI
jgi:hypothetical protein